MLRRVSVRATSVLLLSLASTLVLAAPTDQQEIFDPTSLDAFETVFGPAGAGADRYAQKPFKLVPVRYRMRTYRPRNYNRSYQSRAPRARAPKARAPRVRPPSSRARATNRSGANRGLKSISRKPIANRSIRGAKRALRPARNMAKTRNMAKKRMAANQRMAKQARLQKQRRQAQARRAMRSTRALAALRGNRAKGVRLNRSKPTASHRARQMQRQRMANRNSMAARKLGKHSRFRAVAAGKRVMPTKARPNARYAMANKMASRQHARGRCSFDPETMVVTQAGLKSIIDVRAFHDQVQVWNESTGKFGWRPVMQKYSEWHAEQYLLTVAQGDVRTEIKTTERHPFYVEGKGWLRTADLAAGDQLKLAGNSGIVASISIEAKPHRAYNLDVYRDDTYLVAAPGATAQNAVLVHNSKGCKWDGGKYTKEFNRVAPGAAKKPPPRKGDTTRAFNKASGAAKKTNPDKPTPRPKPPTFSF